MGIPCAGDSRTQLAAQLFVQGERLREPNPDGSLKDPWVLIADMGFMPGAFSKRTGDKMIMEYQGTKHESGKRGTSREKERHRSGKRRGTSGMSQEKEKARVRKKKGTSQEKERHELGKPKSTSQENARESGKRPRVRRTKRHESGKRP